MDARADVYAAGLVIYEMITGLPADAFPRLGEQAEPIAAEGTLCRLVRLALGACQPDPQERFANAQAMLTELTAPQAPSANRPRRRMIASIACLTGVAVLAMIFPLYWVLSGW